MSRREQVGVTSSRVIKQEPKRYSILDYFGRRRKKAQQTPAAPEDQPEENGIATGGVSR